MKEANLAKIAVTTSADEALSNALDRVNTGFEGGRITKADLASWLIAQSASALDDAGIEEIRRAHFNQVAYLESLLRKLKSSGRESLDSGEFATLQAFTGQQQPVKRRARVHKIDEPSENDTPLQPSKTLETKPSM